IKAKTLAFKASTLVNEPRLSTLRTRIESQISIWFIQELWMPRVMEHDLMGRVAQEGGPAHHRGQDAALAFNPQVRFNP
ncbi:MAG: hypothetical protein ACXVCM_24060, partial [Ktedonobacteraceae bacterium]